MDWDLINKFKNQLHLAQKAVSDLDQNDIRFSANIDREKGARFELQLPPEKQIARFAAVMRNLADPSSAIYFKKIASLLTENKLATLSDDETESIQRMFLQIDAGPCRFIVNQESLSAINLFTLYANGEFFLDSKAEAAKVVEYKQKPVISKFMLYNFYSYNFDVYKACCYLYSLIKEVKNKKTELEINTVLQKQNHKCIYCLNESRSYRYAEHVYPEALGNTEIILPPGYVCDTCNNEVLSALDSHLVNHDVISTLRVFYVPYNTKTGKFPKARYQNMSIEKTKPREVEIKVQGKSSKSLHIRTEGDVTHCKFHARGRQKFDPLLLGRALYKIALGILCWQNGYDAVMESKYDLARNFVLGESKFQNNLILSSEFQPNEFLGGQFFVNNPGTIFNINIFGMSFLFNLEPVPVVELNPELVKLNAVMFSLSE